jgi:hypothetical protein
VLLAVRGDRCATASLALEGFRVKWKHFTARKSRKTKNLDPDFDSIKIEQGLGHQHAVDHMHDAV